MNKSTIIVIFTIGLLNLSTKIVKEMSHVLNNDELRSTNSRESEWYWLAYYTSRAWENIKATPPSSTVLG